jgi:hypothetical protein
MEGLSGRKPHLILNTLDLNWLPSTYFRVLFQYTYLSKKKKKNCAFEVCFPYRDCELVSLWSVSTPAWELLDQYYEKLALCE